MKKLTNNCNISLKICHSTLSFRGLMTSNNLLRQYIPGFPVDFCGPYNQGPSLNAVCYSRVMEVRRIVRRITSDW